MAIVWGSWASGSGTNEFRVGIDLSVSGTTITAKYYAESLYTVDDGMTLTRTGAITGSTSFQMVQGSSGGSQLVTTKTRTGSRGTSYSFGASISGIYNGASPSVSGVSITVPALVPSTPARPTISNVTSSSARVNWSHPNNNGATLLEYEVQRATNSGFSSGVVTQGGITGTSWTRSGLSANTQYYVRIRVRNSVGWSSWSSASAAFTTNPLAPNAPSTPSVSRTSDTRHTVSWTRNATTARPYASQQVQRRAWTNSGGWGNWATIATVSASVTSFADTGTIANRGYQYRIVAVNATGTGTSGESVSVRTTPAAATNLQAVKSGSSIAVTGTEAQQATPDVTYEWQDNPGGTGWATVSGTTSSPSRTFTGVNQSVTHQYRTRASVSSGTSNNSTLYSAWSSPTDVVQLLAPPLAPSTSAAFNPSLPANRRVAGVVDRDMDVRLPFTHQSVDSSAQSAAEVQWRVDGGAWTTIALTTQAFATVAAPGVSGTLEWQARTKGDHPDFGPWSPVQAAQLVFRTLVTVSGPSGLIHTSRAVAEWEIYNADGGQQAAWSASLLTDDGTVIESRSGTGSATRSVAFTTPLVDATSYRVRVEVRGSNQLWSDPAESVFETDFPLPVPATVGAEWDREQGATVITLDVPEEPRSYEWAGEADNSESIMRDADGNEIARNLFTNPRLVGSGTWAEVARNLIINPDGVPPFSTFSGYALNIPAQGSISPIGDGIVRYTQSAEGAGQGVFAVGSTIAEGKFYSSSIEVRASGTIVGKVGNTRVYNGASFITNTKNLTFTEEWQTVRAESSVASSVSATARIYVYLPPAQPGDTIEFRNPVLQQVSNIGQSVTVNRLSGSTMPTDIFQPEDFRVRWIGTENNSESVMEIEQVRGLAGLNCIPGVSTDPETGEPAVRLISTNATANPMWTYAIYNMPSGGVRDSGTILGTRYAREPNPAASLTLSGINSRNPDSFSGATTAAGRFSIRHNYSNLTSTYIFQLGHGGALGSPDIWWTDIGLFAGNYDGEAFSGSDQSTTTADEVDVQWWHEGRGEWVTIAEGIDPNASLMHTTPYLTSNRYRAITRNTSLPSETVGEETVQEVGETLYHYLNAGESLGEVWTVAANPTFSSAPSRERAIVRPSGATWPLTIHGPARSNACAASWTVIPPVLGWDHLAPITAWEQLAWTATDMCYRDPEGRRIVGTLTSMTVTQDGYARRGVQIAFEQTED